MLKHMREKANLSLKAVSIDLDISYSTIYMIERAVQENVNYKTIRKLYNYYQSKQRPYEFLNPSLNRK